MRLRAIILFVVTTLVPALAEAAELSPKETADARKIYISKCAKCHELYDPKTYPDSEWAVWMKKMGKKSRLKPEQLQLVERYTDTLRKPPVPPANP